VAEPRESSGSVPEQTISLLDFLLKLSNSDTDWNDEEARAAHLKHLSPKQREVLVSGSAAEIRELILEEERASGRLGERHGLAVLFDPEDGDGRIFALHPSWVIVAMIHWPPPTND